MTLTAQRASPPGLVLHRQRVRRSAGSGARAQQVLIPERVYRGTHYSDDAVATYTKVRALDDRPEHCTASVENIAGYLGVSKSVVERGLTQLGRPGPGGVTELATRRQTHPGGRGQTAERRVRRPARGEAVLRVPVLAAEALTGRQYRAYLLLRHAGHHGLPISAAELAGELFHHHGAQAGLPVSERTARRLMRQLAALGWITLDARAGYQGRHVADVHTHPLRPDNDDGSGPDTPDGSLAIKEDQLALTDREVAQAVAPSAVRRDTAVACERAVDNPPPPVPASSAARLTPVCGAGYRPPRTAPPRAAYTGPDLTLSERVWRALEPVRDLLPELSPWALRRAAREAGAQLDAGATIARLADRIERRRALLGGRPADPGGWLLGVGLPRWGCGLDACEGGWLHRPWAPGPPVPCEVCAETAARRHLARSQHDRTTTGIRPHPPPPQPAPRRALTPIGT